MDRDELIKFIVEAAWEIEGAVIDPEDFSLMSDAQLEEEADWYDHLLDK
jgi:hypothetical protein